MTAAARLTEAMFQRRVIDYARLRGWKVCHFRAALTKSGRYATPMSGDIGFPDLVMSRRGHVLFAELKGPRGQLRPEQRAWLDELGAFGRCWRPSDWESIVEELK